MMLISSLALLLAADSTTASPPKVQLPLSVQKAFERWFECTLENVSEVESVSAEADLRALTRRTLEECETREAEFMNAAAASGPEIATLAVEASEELCDRMLRVFTMLTENQKAQVKGYEE